MKNQFDIIVIGAGPGGATFASLAANAGKKVLVVDKNPSAGGKMMTIHRDGHYYEMFPLNLIPFAPSRFEELMDITGKHVRNVAEGTGDKTHSLYISPAGKVTELNISDKAVLKELGINNPISLIRIMRFFKKILKMDETEINKLNHISAFDYIDKQKLPHCIKIYITAAMGEGAFEMSSDMVPASHMIRMFQTVTSKEHSTPRYYEGGVGGFFTKVLETVTDNGGEILFKTRVEKILTENERVTGVLTASGDQYYAPVVVSSAGIRQTVKFLVGEEKFPAEYSAQVAGLHSNLCDIGYRYFTNKKVLKDSTYVLFPYNCLESWDAFSEYAVTDKKPEGNYIYIGTKSNYPTIGPNDGRQVIYAVMSCVPKLNQDFSKYLEYIEKRVASVFPQLYEEGTIEHKEVMSLKACCALGVDPISSEDGGESYGIADCIGQTDDEIPHAETPMKGLYIVGNDAEGFGVGTHRAVDSGFKVFEKVLERGV